MAIISHFLILMYLCLSRAIKCEVSIKCKMSEDTANKITCRVCSEKVSPGNFCNHCGNRINEQTESINGSESDGPRPPIQESDASSSSSSGTGTKSSRQQSDASVVGVSPTTNSGSHQSNISIVTSTSTTTVPSSYADKVKSPKQNVPQSQQSNNSLASDVTTNSDPQSQDSRHRNTREGSRAANVAPGKSENGGNSLREV